MAVKNVHLDDCYIPKSQDQNITVEVTIGDGQSGSYSIFLGKTLVSVNEPAHLGTRADIQGTRTTIAVVIVDELKETNWTSISARFIEGGEVAEFGPYKTQAENHLDTIIYTLKVVHQ
jgi:hypothetical protein